MTRDDPVAPLQERVHSPTPSIVDMRPTVVLDKNFLQGSKSAEIRRMAEIHRLLMCDALFYELIDNARMRATCFRKFPETANPVELISNPGPLMRREIQ